MVTFFNKLPRDTELCHLLQTFIFTAKGFHFWIQIADL